jgi:hypothetical protein
LQPLHRAPGAIADDVTTIRAVVGHVAMLAKRGEKRVVLERKMSRHDRQVNARFMSSCVSNVQRDLCCVMTKARACA